MLYIIISLLLFSLGIITGLILAQSFQYKRIEKDFTKHVKDLDQIINNYNN